MKTKKGILTFAVIMAAVAISNCTSKTGTISKIGADSLRSQLVALTAGNEAIVTNLSKFDTLDFTVFSNQQWTLLHESHAQDITVHWPDGHFTTGIERHIEDLKAMFVYAPNAQIKEHPVRISSGRMTAGIGVMTGTFTKPMPTGNGKFIQPTGKSFKLPMCTVGIWKEDGTMSEEYLFWDNQTNMNQIGLGK